MLSGARSSSLSTVWRLILQIWRTFDIWVRPPGRSFADTGGGKGDLSDNWNAATPSCWISDHNSWMISTRTRIHPTVVIWLLWAHDSIWVARRFWLPCHILNKLWTLAILCRFHSSASFVISELFSVFVVSNSLSESAKILVLDRGNCLTTTFLRKVSPEVSHCLLPMTSRPREKLASTPTQRGMIETMLWATLERLACYDCVSSCRRHQSVMSGNQNVLLISIGSEW